MKRLLTRLFALSLVVCLVAPAFAGSSVEIRLQDGSRWRGAVNDVVQVTVLESGVEVPYTGKITKDGEMYIIIEGDIAGEIKATTIFKADIVTMETVTGDEAVADKLEKAREMTASKRKDAKKDAYRDGKPLGVFYLPLEGGVGQTLRHEDIVEMHEHANTYGPGQIIVLAIKSNGGLVYEAELINEAIDEMRKDHRVVAWINKAVSAGCSTAMSCDEIYFQTNGIAGSVTTIRGRTSVPEAEARKGIEHLVETARKNGYSEHIARAMKLNKYMCSYDKDEETGEVTFYGDLSGEHVLSNGEQNLCFNSTNALHCGFSKGTADTLEDLATLLDLPEWKEIDDEGREIAERRERGYNTMTHDIRRLIARLDYYKTGSGDIKEILGARLKIMKELRRCYDRDELTAYMNIGVEPDDLDRQIAEIRKQLADIRRAERRNGR